MLLSDSAIRELIASEVLRDADDSRVGPVSYDLRNAYFAGREGQKCDSWELAPGDSVFVASRETVCLPNDLAARVLLKNSRIRQGLSLDAPLYFPGHNTRLFYRVTNVSGDVIALHVGAGLAQLVFERVEQPVLAPYKGSFSDEMDFSGMGTYTDVYGAEMHAVEKKVDEVKDIERRMYANVMAIMAVFAAIFTLVNVNMAVASAGLESVLAMNLATVGSFSVLVGLIVRISKQEKSHSFRALLAVGAACFIGAALVMLLL